MFFTGGVDGSQEEGGGKEGSRGKGRIGIKEAGKEEEDAEDKEVVGDKDEEKDFGRRGYRAWIAGERKKIKN